VLHCKILRSGLTLPTACKCAEVHAELIVQLILTFSMFVMQVEVQVAILAEQRDTEACAGMQSEDAFLYEAIQLQATHCALAPQQHAHIAQQQPPGSFHEVQQHVPTLQHGDMLTTSNSVRAASGIKRRSKEQNIQPPDNQQQSLSYSMEDNSTHCQQRGSGSSGRVAVAAFGSAACGVLQEQQTQPQLQRLAAPPVSTDCTLFDFDVMVQQMFGSNTCFSAMLPRHQQQQQHFKSTLAAVSPWHETWNSSSNVLANSVCTASPDVPAPTIAKHGAPATTDGRPAAAAVPLAALAGDAEACRSVQEVLVRELYHSLVKPIPVRMANTMRAHASSECWDF
jgi:hypothetical protein